MPRPYRKTIQTVVVPNGFPHCASCRLKERTRPRQDRNKTRPKPRQDKRRRHGRFTPFKRLAVVLLCRVRGRVGVKVKVWPLQGIGNGTRQDKDRTKTQNTTKTTQTRQDRTRKDSKHKRKTFTHKQARQERKRQEMQHNIRQHNTAYGKTKTQRKTRQGNKTQHKIRQENTTQLNYNTTQHEIRIYI